VDRAAGKEKKLLFALKIVFFACLLRKRLLLDTPFQPSLTHLFLPLSPPFLSTLVLSLSPHTWGPWIQNSPFIGTVHTMQKARHSSLSALSLLHAHTHICSWLWGQPACWQL
jgi:hypothetical protein